MRITSRVFLACFFVCWLSFFGWTAHSYFLEPPPSQQGTPSPTTKAAETSGDKSANAVGGQMLPWKDYQEALKNERDELQKQAKENLDRMDKLQDRIFSAVVLLGGLILAFIYFLFGQTRKEVKTQLTEEISKNVRSQIEQEVLSTVKAPVEAQIKQLAAMNDEMVAILAKCRQMDEELKETQAYKERQVSWFFSGETNTAEREIAALKNAGFEHVDPQKLGIGEHFELGHPDLVIFSYDETEEGERRMGVIASLMRKNTPNVWLLIHCSPQAIQQKERDLLGDLWYFPTNFPATLVTNAKALIRKQHKF